MKKLEICCGSTSDVLMASQFEIDSIELNSALYLGGLTPSLSTLQMCKKMTHVPLYCMVRLVPGGFIYSDLEFETMLRDGKILLENQADGIVFGCLTEDLKIHVDQTKQLIELAHHYNKQAIFHRAFDLIDDQLSAYRQLIDLGINRVLTSGGQPKAINAINRLNELHKINPDKIIVGSGLNPNNIHTFLDQCDVNYIHASCKELAYRLNGNESVSYDYDQVNTTWAVNQDCVKTMVEAIKKHG